MRAEVDNGDDAGWFRCWGWLADGREEETARRMAGSWKMSCCCACCSWSPGGSGTKDTAAMALGGSRTTDAATEMSLASADVVTESSGGISEKKMTRIR